MTSRVVPTPNPHGRRGWARWACAALATCLILLSSCSDSPTACLPGTFAERLQAAVDEGFAQSGGKGISVSVMVPGEPMWTGVAGVSHGSVPITERSVFAAGSITKTFTALTLLRLMEEGYLSLDDSLHTWFPAYPNVDPDITLRQLLNHTSGLSDFVDPPGWFSWLYSDPTRTWDMEEFFLETIRPPYFEKGTAWSYSTSGYLARLGNALMRERTLLEDSTYEEMTDFYFPNRHDEPMAYGYGLGLMWFDPSFVSGQKVLGHGGNPPGYAAGMLHLPDYGAIVALMDNTEEGEAMTVLGPVLEVIMDRGLTSPSSQGGS